MQPTPKAGAVPWGETLLAFLAVADVKRSADWSRARIREGKETLKSRDIIAYLNQHFEEKISMGSYDDIRRKDLKLPVVAGIIIASANKPNAARNDPTRGYSLSPEYVELSFASLTLHSRLA